VTRRSIVIVGGGISGLAAAWELTGGATGPGANPPRIEVIEAHAQLGGALGTMEFAGRTVDCGADGFLARRPEMVTLVKELGWGDKLEAIGASGASLFLKGRFVPLPQGLILGVPTSAQSIRRLAGLSWRAKAAAYRDQWFPRRFTVGDDVSIGAITRAKLGEELTYKFIEPMIGGIQAGRVDHLSATSVFPALIAAARRGGSLMKAIAPSSGSMPGPPTFVPTEGPVFFTITGGVGSLIDELRRQLEERGVVIRTDVLVTAIRKTPTGDYPFEVDTPVSTTPASGVIITTPPRVTASLTRGWKDDLHVLEQVDSAGAVMVTFSIPRGSATLPASGTGVLVPLHTPWTGPDSLMTTALTLLDRKWPSLARNDDHLVRVHLGRSDDTRCSHLGDDELVTRVRAELAFICGSWPPTGEVRVVRWPDALPQYRVGHDELVTKVRSSLPEGIALAGLAYDGVGVPASVGSGRRAAAALMEPRTSS